MTDVKARLDRLRGSVPPRDHDARTIAALTTNPGCARRGVLDAAGIDKGLLAGHAGFPAPFGQSQYAITRGNAFEAQVKADGCAELLRLLRDRLGLPIPEVAYHDLDTVGGRTGRDVRYQRTRGLLRRALDDPGDAGTLFDHPMLRLEVAGQLAHLEPDVIAFRVRGRFHIVEIKSFAVVDGQAEPDQVAAAARQAAVYVLALRAMLAEFGAPDDAVSHEIVLVTPENFANRPTATMIDVRPQLAVLTRQLARMTRVDRIVDALPDGLTLDPAAYDDGAQMAAAVQTIDARYAPDCMSSCELALLCRDEAHACGSTGVLGRAVRDDLGGIESVRTALALATGEIDAAADLAETAAQLRTAARLRRECLDGAA